MFNNNRQISGNNRNNRQMSGNSNYNSNNDNRQNPMYNNGNSQMNNNGNSQMNNDGNYRDYMPTSVHRKNIVAIVIAVAVVFLAILASAVVLTVNFMNAKNDAEKPSESRTEESAEVKPKKPGEDDKESLPGEVDEKTVPEVQEPLPEPVTMYIANVENSVYFRSDAEENADNIITTIPFGTAVLFFGNEDSVFAKIEYNGKTGYVKRDYLSTKIPSKPQKPENNTVVSYKYVNYVENSVYLRKSPSDNSGHYTTIPLGEQVGFIEKANGTYSKVSYNGQIGYVTSKYLSDTYYTSSSDYLTVCNVENSIYLRSDPSENQNNIICTIPVGSRVKYVGYGNNTFYKISWNGKVGYAKSAYLRW